VGSIYGCWNFFDTHEEFAFDNPAETFYLFVDGEGASEGRFGLEVSLTAPMCGDGVTNDLNGTEQCDDGNTTAGDGCDASCNFEVVTLFDTCDGEPLIINSGETLSLTDNTTGYADDYTEQTALCNAQPGGHDRIYEVTAGADGMLTATIGLDATGMLDICDTYGLIDPRCWDYVLWAVGPNACVDMGGTQFACSDSETYGVETISFPVISGEAYHIIVDGFTDYFPGAPTYGPYTLRLEHTP
jgi:cysteine-rich repeat protein